MKPGIPKGTRDFTPDEVNKRNFIFDTIQQVFVTYGYQPIETPTMENLATLTGKYGEEGDRLLFKVLNNGDFLAKADQEALEAKDSSRLVSSISRRGLRYDLTVPFARFVVMHQHEIAFPFKRYQVQPVWRADRPQKGRYQEFYQCDVDVVGSSSLMYEAELASIYDQAFSRLGVKVVIRINNRKILAGLAEVAGISDRLVDMTIALDKLDKIGFDGVAAEMEKRGISAEAFQVISDILKNKELAELKTALAESEIGTRGLEEIEEVFSYFSPGQSNNTFLFDPTLARGLDYYTGCIFEVVADPEAYPNLRMGSIGGGGRYDDLTSVFGMKNLSGVGVSFGAERIYDVMDELALFPEGIDASLPLLFVAFDADSHHFAFRCLQEVRAAGIRADLYPEPLKLKKQMKYANERGTSYVALIGAEELASGQLSFKNMTTGEQEKLGLQQIIDRLREA
jgi:histidyl-tRNA synthetase